MKRFIAALFAAAVFANDEATTTEESTDATTEDEGVDAAEVASDVGDWFSSRQEAVEFTTASGGDC